MAKAPLNVLQFADTELFPRELERSESRIARVASGEEPTDNLQGTGDNLRAPIPIPDRVLCCKPYELLGLFIMANEVLSESATAGPESTAHEVRPLRHRPQRKQNQTVVA